MRRGRATALALGLVLPLGCAESRRVEPEDGPAAARARADLGRASEESNELNSAVRERHEVARAEPGAPAAQPKVAEATAEVAIQDVEWQRARAEALARTDKALGEMDRRLRLLGQDVERADQATARTTLDRARDARLDVVRRLDVLRAANEGTWSEARLQLENAIDTMNEAVAQAETALSRK